MFIGCHVSIAGGIENAPERAANLDCECFQMFTRSPQGGKAPDLTPEILKKFSIQNSKFKIFSFILLITLILLLLIIVFAMEVSVLYAMNLNVQVYLAQNML